jgi:TolB protein
MGYLISSRKAGLVDCVAHAVRMTLLVMQSNWSALLISPNFFCKSLAVLLLFTAATSLPSRAQQPSEASNTSPSLLVPGEEQHLRNIRQLTFGGQNAEAYFSADDRMLSFQHQGEGVPCDQIYTMPVDTPDGKPATPKLVSTGKGRTTCSYIFPSGDRMLYSSTHAASPECPPKPDYSKGYVWPIYDDYKIYTAKLDGSDLRLLTDAPGYNAEATISRDGKHSLHFNAQWRSRCLHHERRR